MGVAVSNVKIVQRTIFH